MSDQGTRNSSQQKARYTPVVIRSFERHSGNSTFWLSYTPILRENTLNVVRTSHLSPLSTNLIKSSHEVGGKGREARRLFRVPPCRKGTIYLETPRP
ncbi:hypothetical protein TNCV_3238561 [Trichonephila clavipes]|nr:hypothetical protein TNCV_3238561 [Trichonephila clavipes]